MPNETIKFKIVQDALSKNVKLEVYRPYGDKNEWMRIDCFNDMSTRELKILSDFLVGVFTNSKKT